MSHTKRFSSEGTSISLLRLLYGTMRFQKNKTKRRLSGSLLGSGVIDAAFGLIIDWVAMPLQYCDKYAKRRRRTRLVRQNMDRN